MGEIKGSKEYKRFKENERLTRKQAILAHCYECNGFDEGRSDCLGYSCALYQYHPYRKPKRPQVSKSKAEDTSFAGFQDKGISNAKPFLQAS